MKALQKKINIHRRCLLQQTNTPTESPHSIQKQNEQTQFHGYRTIKYLCNVIENSRDIEFFGVVDTHT